MTRALGIVLWFACAWLPTVVSAAPLRPSLEDAALRAEENSSYVRRARALLGASEAQRVNAAMLQRTNPSVSVSAGHRHDASGSVPPATGPEWTLHLEQQLDLASRGARMDEVEKKIVVARTRLVEARVQARARARLAYIDVLLADAREEVATQQAKLTGELLRYAHARVQAGASSDMEAQLAEVEDAQAARELIEATLRSKDARLQLIYVMGADMDASLTPATDLASPSMALATMHDLEKRALAHRLDLRALTETDEALDATIIRLKREALPRFLVFADLMQQQPGQTYAGAGVGITIPVFNRNQGDIAETRAEQNVIAEERAMAQDEIRLQVRTAYEAYEAHIAQLSTCDQRIVPASLQRVSMAVDGWRAGKLDFLFVVQSMRDANAARRERLETMGRAWAARIELDRAEGQL